MPTLAKVGIYYACVNKPQLKYKKKAVEGNPYENKEYSLDVLVTEKVLKQLKKTYPGSKALKEAKTLSAKQFEKNYKVEPLERFDNGDDEFFTFKIRKPAWYANSGEPTSKPIVGGIKGGTAKQMGNKDLEGNTVNQDTAIGNGSLGDIQFKIRKYEGEEGSGVVLDLIALCVRNLVPYVAAGPELEFDFVEDDEASEDDDQVFGDDEDDEVTSGEDEPADAWEDD